MTSNKMILAEVGPGRKSGDNNDFLVLCQYPKEVMILEAWLATHSVYKILLELSAGQSPSSGT